MSTPSLELGPGSYGRMSYDKPALMLRTLERTLGRETLLRAMSTYFERFAFRHPKPQDFFDVVEEVSGEDLTEFWDAVYYGSGTFDYAVEDVRSKHATKIRGLLEPEAGAEGAGEGAGDGEPRFVEKKVEPSELFPAAVDSSVIVRRWGDAILPVDVRFTFEDGHVIDERWDGRDRWKRYDFRHPTEIVRVEVDPERKIALDVDTINNTWMKDAPARAASLKWASRWTLWLQNVLEQLAFFS